MAGEVRVDVGAVWATLRAPQPVRDVVAEYLTLEMRGARFTPQFKAGFWDGKIRLYDKRTDRFPAGLAYRVVAHLKDAHQLVTTFGESFAWKPSTPYCTELQGITLTPHQDKAVQQALTAHRLIIQSPTGSGKTEIGAELVRQVGLNTLWMVHRKDLLNQTAERLSLRLGGLHVGRIGDKLMDVQPVTVGMVQTLHTHKHLPFWEQWKVLVLDETHHASAMTWYDCAMRCTKATWRFGLSATPMTGDPLKDSKLEGATGPLYVVSDIMTLASKGFLATPKMVMLDQADPNSYPAYAMVRDQLFPGWRKNRLMLRRMGSRVYNEMYKQGISQNPVRNKLLTQVAMKHATKNERVMILVTRIPHGLSLYKRIQQDGRRGAWFLSGKEPTEKRTTTLKAFKASTTGAVLIASPIFNEGVDVPEIDVLIVAGGGGPSEILVVQRIGRALRRRPDKDEVLIYDVLDGRDPHDEKDYLAAHTHQRLQVYRRHKFTVVRTTV